MGEDGPGGGEVMSSQYSFSQFQIYFNPNFFFRLWYAKAAGWWWCHSSQNILTPIVYIWIKFCPLFTFEFPFSNSNSRGRDLTMHCGFIQLPPTPPCLRIGEDEHNRKVLVSPGKKYRYRKNSGYCHTLWVTLPLPCSIAKEHKGGWTHNQIICKILQYLEQWSVYTNHML